VGAQDARPREYEQRVVGFFERSRDEHPQMAPLSSQNPQVARTMIGSSALEARRW
jgi:hypothetical protein